MSEQHSMSAQQVSRQVAQQVGHQEQASTKATQQTSVLDLPAPCLLAIMQHCSSVYRSLFSAARAHNTLRSAAAAALTSIKFEAASQDQLDNLVLYLSNHGHHVKRLHLSSPQSSWMDSPLDFTLRQLPAQMQLQSLRLQLLTIWLLPSFSTNNQTPTVDKGSLQYRGVLTGQSQLTKLVLLDCVMGEGTAQVAAGLRQLPQLLHLDVGAPVEHTTQEPVTFPGEVLSDLQALTYLSLSGGAMDGSSALDHISALTALQDLSFDPEDNKLITGAMFERVTALTSLRWDCSDASTQLEPEVLSNKPRLRHLHLGYVSFTYGCDGNLVCTHPTAAVLSQLQHLQAITHLDLQGALTTPRAPGAAFTALAACSNLRYLNISYNRFPPDVWQQLFAPANQLPHLRHLDVTSVRLDDDPLNEPSLQMTAADAQRLVSCCPGLQQLHAQWVLRDAAALAALSALSSLHTLEVQKVQPGWADAVSQCKHLVYLEVSTLPRSCFEDAMSVSIRDGLLQLTQLTGLTMLRLNGDVCQVFYSQDFEHLPVWQQVQKFCETHPTETPAAS